MALTEEGLIQIPGMLSRYVRLGSGALAHYMTAGETGPAVVLLHGGIIGSSGLAGWRFMAPFLGSNGFRVYCPDLPGFGLTADYEEAYAPHEGGHLDFVQDFVTALGLERFHIAGNSMGCMNAVYYITAHPDKIISYVLIAGGIGDIGPVQEMPPKGSETPPEGPNVQMFNGSSDSMQAMMSAIILNSSTVSDDLVAMRTAAANRHRDYYQRYVDTALRNPDPNQKASLSTKDRFPKLTIPGIYMYGTKDALRPHDVFGHAQEDALPAVQFFYPEDTGHQGQTDQPEMFNQVFLEFFRDGKVSAKSAEWAGVSRRRPVNPERVEVTEGAAV